MNIAKKIKRTIASALAIAMTVSLLVPVGSIDAYANTNTELELLPMRMDDNDGGTTTAFKWKSASAYDIEGIAKEEYIGAENPYQGNGNGIQTTYGHNGYTSYIGLSNSDKTVVSMQNKANIEDDEGNPLEPTNNGGVFAHNIGGKKIEVQMKLYPSKDQKWIIVEYGLYNNSSSPVSGIKIGASTDIQLTNDDNAALYRTKKSLRMTNKNFETFELITHDPQIGVYNWDDTPIAGFLDGTPTINTWMGNFTEHRDNVFTHSPLDYFNASVDHSNSNRKGDSAIAYSWEIDFGPYEKVTKKVAFGTKGPNYYVAPDGSDTNPGSYDAPYKTIRQAVTKLDGKMGYVFIQPRDGGYAEIIEMDSTIEVSTGTNITFASADYDRGGEPSDVIMTLQRASGTGGPLFKTTGSGTVRIGNLVLDGNKEYAGAHNHPILKGEENSTIGLQVGAVLQNNKVTGESMGSAIDITGNANLDINYGTVSGNVSNGSGAVNFNSDGTFTVQNKITISGNTKTDNKTAANVYLATGKHVTVVGDLDESTIGVTTQQSPAVTIGGNSTEAAQEVKAAAPQPGNAVVDIVPAPFVDNFVADNTALVIEGGTVDLPGTTDNGKNVVLKKNGYTITRHHLDTAGASIEADSPTINMGFGDPVTIEKPSTITGYTLTGISVDQGSANPPLLNVDADKASPTFGKITGTMPNQDVTVVYEYTRDQSSITFQANGGTPQPPTLTGAVGDPVKGTLMNITRYGYIFDGWTATESWEAPNYPTIIPGLDTVFPIAPKTYYAVFKPDPNITFDYTVEHTNQDGGIEFKKEALTPSPSVETGISGQAETINGYKWSKSDSSIVPEQYIYDNALVPVGTFDAAGAFTGKMPGQDTTLSYRYEVNYDDPTTRSALKVNHETEGGTIVSPVQESDHHPEEAISTQPVDKYGYECTGVNIEAGDEDHSVGGLVTVLEIPEGGIPTDGVFTSKMPNQDVTITYIYEATGEGYPLTVQYKDRDTQDENLKDIITPIVHTHQAEQPVGTVCTDPEDGPIQYQQPYGYTLGTESGDKTIVPDTDIISWMGNDFSGRMPNQDVMVTYIHDREPSKWADITYEVGLDALGVSHGQLVSVKGDKTISPDVTDLLDGTFKASVLFNDGSEGSEAGYTLEMVTDKGLMPIADPSQYYQFAGWFIDTNNNKKLDNGEELLEDIYQFTGAVTLTAHFVEDPDQWLDVFFEAGSRGSINAGQPISLHTTKDKTWNDIRGSLPLYTAQINYLPDGWYAGETPMEPTMVLVKDQTYTIQFYPDPGVFGTAVRDPDAAPSINNQGKGRITVFNTTAGYNYILTDLDGNILEVIRGNDMTERVIFDDWYPGTRYRIYEATGRAEAGTHIDSVTGAKSNPVEVLIPVVETNYQVYYDEENEGKTVLIIRPADADSDYALIDSQGNVVETSGTSAGGWKTPSGSPASVSFGGLDYNAEYTVVARPKGQTDITALSKLADGTVISTDPGGELELPRYIVETVGGEIDQVGGIAVGAARYEEAHKGDRVTLTAEAANAAGQAFSHWEFLIGSVKELGNKPAQRNLTFTMPDTNLVLAAVYERSIASPANAVVEDEVRGGSPGEMALDPSEIPGLEASLTTEEDSELISVNGADVTYKVIYRKNAVTAQEAEIIKEFQENAGHEKAFKGAWGLDVSLERYVNGRKIGVATDSNAEFNTYVQLEKDDLDMMDYQLYEVTEDTDGNVQADRVDLGEGNDPEETGGLFAFTAKAGARYVMVYHRAYRLYFLNNTAPEDDSEGYRYRHDFKVRRDEAPVDTDYAGTDGYGGVAEEFSDFVNSHGAEYNYVGWSYRENDLREFDPNRRITRKTYVYAYYKNNVKEVDDTRNELEDAIDDAIKLSDDNFLKNYESEAMKDAINSIVEEILDKKDPKATIDELKAALDQLKGFLEPYEELLEERYDNYDDLQHHGNSGGGGGGGGGGRGTKKEPFDSKSPKNYEVGTNGSWVESTGPNGERQLSFVLNGGKALSSMWARLVYPEGQDQSNGWYHFNRMGVMDTGWFRDEKGDWYYCSKGNEGTLGKMATGWRKDTEDGNWYHLNPETGIMSVGWRQIEGKWYYFETQGAGVYVYDPLKEVWIFGGGSGRPLGSMYKNETTPDGFKVDENGAWIQ